MKYEGFKEYYFLQVPLSLLARKEAAGGRERPVASYGEPEQEVLSGKQGINTLNSTSRMETAREKV